MCYSLLLTSPRCKSEPRTIVELFSTLPQNINLRLFKKRQVRTSTHLQIYWVYDASPVLFAQTKPLSLGDVVSITSITFFPLRPFS